MTENIRHASGHQGGVQLHYVLDLAEKDFNNPIISRDFLPYAKVEVWIKGIGATGFAGNAIIKEGPNKSSADHATILGNVPVSANTANAGSFLLSSSHISVELPALPAVGKVEIFITAKDN